MGSRAGKGNRERPEVGKDGPRAENRKKRAGKESRARVRTTPGKVPKGRPVRWK